MDIFCYLFISSYLSESAGPSTLISCFGSPSDFGGSSYDCEPYPSTIRWEPMSQQNPCMRCGACCAMYRVAFDCHETDNFPGGVIPFHLVFKLDETRSAMLGTEKRPIRCQALSGNIGQAVHCMIYALRPTTCRKFLSVWESSAGNSLCDQARSKYGLIPLSDF